MSEHDTAFELSTNATLATGLALLAVVAVGGGGLVASLDGAQVGYYLSDGSAGWAAGGAGVGGGVFAGGVVGGLALSGATGTALSVGITIGGPLGAAVGAGVGAL